MAMDQTSMVVFVVVFFLFITFHFRFTWCIALISKNLPENTMQCCQYMLSPWVSHTVATYRNEFLPIVNDFMQSTNGNVTQPLKQFTNQTQGDHRIKILKVNKSMWKSDAFMKNLMKCLKNILSNVINNKRKIKLLISTRWLLFMLVLVIFFINFFVSYVQHSNHTLSTKTLKSRV